MISEGFIITITDHSGGLASCCAPVVALKMATHEIQIEGKQEEQVGHRIKCISCCGILQNKLRASKDLDT